MSFVFEQEFGVHGIALHFRAHDLFSKRILEKLVRDFAAFSQSFEFTRDGATVVVDLKAGTWLQKRGAFVLKTSMARAFGWGDRRFCDYGRAQVCTRGLGRHGRRVLITGVDGDAMYEAAYVSIISALGESLDKKRFHRVHALGFSAGGHGAILVAPSGGGKSSLAWNLLADPAVQIFSDESPLLKGGLVYDFPVRIAMRPELTRRLGAISQRVFRRKIYGEKLLFEINPERVSKPIALNWVFVGRVGHVHGRRPKIKRLHGLSGRVRGLTALVWACVVGVGLTQMAEHILRLPALPDLLRIAFSRLGESLRAVTRAEIYLFDLSEDPAENYLVLQEFLGRRITTVFGEPAAPGVLGDAPVGLDC